VSSAPLPGSAGAIDKVAQAIAAVVIPDTRTLVPLDQPARTAELIERFVAKSAIRDDAAV
jgi:hypothetical protein